MTLLEKYSQRLNVAESYYAANHEGAKLDNNRKLIVARLLENTNRYLSEAFDNSVGTQRSNMGAFKKFTMNLVNVAIPNLIAPELVIVKPMSAMTGYVTYLSFTAGSNKGGVNIGDTYNSPFALDPENKFQNGQYTSSRVTISGGNDADTTATPQVAASTTSEIPLKWSPIIPGSILLTAGNTRYVDGTDANGQARLYTVPAGANLVEVVSPNGCVSREWVLADGSAATLTVVEGSVVNYGSTRDAKFAPNTAITGMNPVNGSITSEAGEGGDPLFTITGAYTLSYLYDNAYIPQNDVPLLNAEMKGIALQAKPRRIAVYYSQMAAFQAKEEYGMDLGKEMAAQAVGQLAYEIDNEVVQTLANTADNNGAAVQWNKTLPVGVSMAEHYVSFVETVNYMSGLIYSRTKKYAPTYIVVAWDVLPILSMIPAFKAAPASSAVAGPYFAGTLNNLKVFVSPALATGKFYLGVNSGDLAASVAIYAPFMPIVPTQLLGFADGAMNQGFSTLYDIKVINPALIVAGQVITAERPENLNTVGVING